MSYKFDWDVVFTPDMITIVVIGLKYTSLVSVLSLLLGNVIGLLAALMRISHKAPFSQIAYIYIDFFRTTPALVQLIWIFYVLPIVIGINLDPISAGVIALSLNAGAFLAEVFRGGMSPSTRVSGMRHRSSAFRASRVSSMCYCPRLCAACFRRRGMC